MITSAEISNENSTVSPGKTPYKMHEVKFKPDDNHQVHFPLNSGVVLVTYVVCVCRITRVSLHRGYAASDPFGMSSI